MSLKQLLTFAVYAAAVLSEGCTHVVSDDYRHFLDNHAGESRLPTIPASLVYDMDPETADHHIEFRSNTIGAEHRWVVEFGTILHATLQSRDVRQAFKSHGAPSTVHLHLQLEQYEFIRYTAIVALHVHATNSAGVTTMDRIVRATGSNEAGFWTFLGASWAMREAIQTSTKAALDSVMSQIINELNGTDS